MSDFAFVPLELWRASSLAGETKQVIAAYERMLASGDFAGLATLRSKIEGRIAELEDFYAAHLDDERGVLFDKQRMKLRKLLHEYDQAVLQLQGGGGGGGGGAVAARDAAASPLATTWQLQPPPAPSAGGDYGDATREIAVTDKSRLTLAELSAWFKQAGYAELRDKLATGEVRSEVTLPVLEQVFRSITRTNVDGKMSIRDIRQWYISYGKRALAKNIANFDGELVPVALLKSSVSGHGASSVAAKKFTPQLPTLPKGIYSWEQGYSAAEAPADAPGASAAAPASASSATSAAAASAAAAAAAAAADADVAPLRLPNHLLEFQVRLTPEEYSKMCLRRRQYEGELRFRERIAKAEKAKTQSKARGFGEIPSAVRDGEFVDASAPTSYLFRSATHNS